MPVFTGAATRAHDLLGRFGETGLILRATGSTGPAWDPETITEAEHPARLAVADFKAEELDGSGSVLATDAQIFVSAVGLDLIPSTADRVSTSAGIFHVAAVKTVQVAGVAILYELVGRR